MPERRRLAAIDIGTVTTRLLVADVAEGTIDEVHRSTDITHLGEGLSATGALSDEAMERVCSVIDGYAAEMRELGVEAYKAMATSASRDAANGPAFRSALARTGIDVCIIEGSLEAELAFGGATALRGGENLLVVDCGGGSTELISGDAPDKPGGPVEIRASRSYDVGSRRMTERYLASDPPRHEELAEARVWAATEMRGFFDRMEERPSEVIGLAGTATSLVAIKLGLERYDASVVHGQRLSGSDISDLLEMLASMDLESRKRITGLHPGRASVIVAGALIFETVLALSGLDSMMVSEHDILYGILLDTYRDLLEVT